MSPLPASLLQPVASTEPTPSLLHELISIFLHSARSFLIALLDELHHGAILALYLIPLYFLCRWLFKCCKLILAVGCYYCCIGTTLCCNFLGPCSSCCGGTPSTTAEILDAGNNILEALIQAITFPPNSTSIRSSTTTSSNPETDPLLPSQPHPAETLPVPAIAAPSRSVSPRPAATASSGVPSNVPASTALPFDSVQVIDRQPSSPDIMSAAVSAV